MKAYRGLSEYMFGFFQLQVFQRKAPPAWDSLLLDAYATPQNYAIDKIHLFPRAEHKEGGDRDQHGPGIVGNARDGVGRLYRESDRVDRSDQMEESMA
jgi:hypothetical protein